MIIYNIRDNGPYEYDKMTLLSGQLYNIAEDMFIKYEESKIIEQNEELKNMLSKIIGEDSLLMNILLIKYSLE